MYRKLFCIVFLLLIVLPSCKRNTVSDELNVMCTPYEASVFDKLYLDTGRMKPNCIAPDYNEASQNNWHDDLITSLMTKNSGMDMYLIESTDSITYKIIKDQYYVDLAQYEDVSEYYDGMDPNIREWCMDENRIFGFPAVIYYPMHISANTSLINSIGYGVRDLESITGFLDFCTQWEDRTNTPLYDAFVSTEDTTAHLMKVRFYYINYMYTQYDRINGTLDLNTPEFRRILEQCRELYLTEDLFKGTFYPYGFFCTNKILHTHSIPLFLNCVDIIQNNQDYRPISYPLVDGENNELNRYCHIRWLIVNPSGRHIEEAIEYLELWARYAKEKRLVAQSALYIPDGYPSVSEERLRGIRDFLSQCYVGYGFPGDQEVFAILDAYVYDGAKTLDEAVAEAQDLLDTIRQEQYIGQ